MKIIAVVPMKLNNQRLPQKNTKCFTNGKPLCHYVLSTLLKIENIDEVYVYCSNPEIVNYIPEGVKFLQRSSELDKNTTKMNEVLKCFSDEVRADYYVMTHTTAPFISSNSISKGLKAVLHEGYDSAFAAKKLQDFLWKDGQPFNYSLDSIPRTQDLPVLYEETSGFYIFDYNTIRNNRRIGDRPYIVEVGEVESVDIDEAEDFVIADAIYNFQKMAKNNSEESFTPSGGVGLLDCTLRDGGYCNSWKFGEAGIKKIINSLILAGVDIVECGFLTNKIEYVEGITKYSSVANLHNIIPDTKGKTRFALMVNYGEYSIEDVPDKDCSNVDIIRVAFHKKDCGGALQLCKGFQSKGYKVFLQPMVTMNYSDDEFVDLIKLVNELSPEACYLVDSFGTMKKSDLVHYLAIIDESLDEKIKIGFHSHNNIQSALSNAIEFAKSEVSHDLIIDSTIYGMGRGAGNLNTELFIPEINAITHKSYDVKPLLRTMDEVISRFYNAHPWGYSLPNYLSASHMIHPNYAGFYSRKNTLTIDAMDDIFETMDKSKAVEYDEKYAEEKYYEYMSKDKSNEDNLKTLKRLISGNKVLLVAPGKSVSDEKEKINSFIDEENLMVIGVNHSPNLIKTDYILASNMRRYRELDPSLYDKTIITSNVKGTDSFISVDYYALQNMNPNVHDNSGLMGIRLMIDCGCTEVWLAGYDGYEYDSGMNYDDDELQLTMDTDQIDLLNMGIKEVIGEYCKQIPINFLTNSKYEKFDCDGCS